MNPEFYEDEVIEGFYVPSMLKKAWGVQMDVLNETDRICRKHDIPYFADWGTLLAAIRHGGYSPWDDDLDISMRRKDYERFLKIAEKELPEGFKVMHFKNHPGHHFFVARIVGKPRICFEEDHLKRFHGFPYIAGIDLFVLDNVCRDRQKEQLRSKKAEYVLTVADNIADGVTKGREKEDLLRQCEKYTGKRIDRRLTGEALRVEMYGIVESLFASVSDDESDELVQMMPYGLYGKSLYIPKKFYEKTVRIPYMSGTIQVPLCYDAVMRRKFGNYMQIRRAVAGHDYPFFAGQHKQLLETLDFEYPAYHITEDDITSECVRSEGIKEISVRFLADLKETVASVISGDISKTYDLHQMCVDLGTYIESVYGEGYAPVRVLEEMCELAYRASINEDVAADLDICVERLEKSIEGDIVGRRDIVFMPFAPKHWKYMEKLYRHYANDSSCHVHVVPIPYYYRGWDGEFSEEVFDPAGYPPDVVISDHTKVDLEGMHPEKIVIQNPFDEWNTVMSVAKNMYSSVIRKYTDELIYIPFFVTSEFTKEYSSEYSNMDYYVCVPGVVNADRIILPYCSLKETYIEKLMEFAACSSDRVRKVLDDRISVNPEYVRFDSDDSEYEADEGRNDGKKTIVYFTTISFLAEHSTGAIEKIKRTLELFGNESDRIRVIWISQCCRDHLDLIDREVAEGFREAVRSFENMHIGEYLEDLPVNENKRYAVYADAYYGDPSSLALAFYYEHKPVMIAGADV